MVMISYSVGFYNAVSYGITGNLCSYASYRNWTFECGYPSAGVTVLEGFHILRGLSCGWSD